MAPDKPSPAGRSRLRSWVGPRGRRAGHRPSGSGLHDVSTRRPLRDRALSARALRRSLPCRHHSRASRPLRHDIPCAEPEYFLSTLTRLKQRPVRAACSILIKPLLNRGSSLGRSVRNEMKETKKDSEGGYEASDFVPGTTVLAVDRKESDQESAGPVAPSARCGPAPRVPSRSSRSTKRVPRHG